MIDIYLYMFCALEMSAKSEVKEVKAGAGAAKAEKEKAPPAPISTLRQFRPSALFCGVNRDPNAIDWFDVDRYSLAVCVLFVSARVLCASAAVVLITRALGWQITDRSSQA